MRAFRIRADAGGKLRSDAQRRQIGIMQEALSKAERAAAAQDSAHQEELRRLHGKANEEAATWTAEVREAREQAAKLTTRAEAAERETEALRQELRQATQRLSNQEATLKDARSALAKRKEPKPKREPTNRTLESLRRKLRQAELRIAEQTAELRAARGQTKSAVAKTRKSQRQYDSAVRMLNTERSQRTEQAKQRSSRVRVAPRKAPPRRTAIQPITKQVYPAKAIDGLTRTAAEGLSPRGAWSSKGTPAARQKRERFDERVRAALIDLDAKALEARGTVLTWNYHQGYRPESDQLVLLKIQEMQAENELAMAQSLKGRRVTAQRIQPGTDVLRVAALWGIEARSAYVTRPPRSRRTEACWRRQYFLLDAESEEDLEARLVRSLIKLRFKLRQ